jgi:coenzyme F420-reducing hydrogenase delta subunit
MVMVFQCSFQSGKKKKNRRVTNLENMAQVATERFDVVTKTV